MRSTVLDSSAGLLSTGGDTELLDELVSIFLEIVPAQVDNLKKALAAGDRSTTAHEAHSLKGSAAAIGVGDIRRLAADIEDLARDGDLTSARPLADAITEVLARLESEHSARQTSS